MKKETKILLELKIKESILGIGFIIFCSAIATGVIFGLLGLQKIIGDNTFAIILAVFMSIVLIGLFGYLIYKWISSNKEKAKRISNVREKGHRFDITFMKLMEYYK
jgi:predicted permease